MKKVNKRKLKETESLSPDSKKRNSNVSFLKPTGKQTKLRVTGGMFLIQQCGIFRYFPVREIYVQTRAAIIFIIRRSLLRNNLLQ